MECELLLNASPGVLYILVYIHGQPDAGAVAWLWAQR